jgi:hypothetical protein
VFVRSSVKLQGAGGRPPWSFCCGVKGEMPKRVFTPAAIQTVRELAAQEKTAAEIARQLGSTAASVRVKCCHLKIRPQSGLSR